jgi:hypothetical protein
MFDALPIGLKPFRTHLGIGAADMAPLASHHRGYSALPHDLADMLKRLPRG